MGQLRRWVEHVKFGGLECEQVDKAEACPGDYFLWNEKRGRQVGTIARVDIKRGHVLFVTEEVKPSSTRIARRSRRIPFQQVVSVWRKTKACSKS